MFVDVAHIRIKSGNGGDGAITFHREKYMPHGGPDGGDGGKGGDVIFLADKGLNTLSIFRHKRKFFAQNGENGKKNNCSGKNGKDIIIKVPYGTIVKDTETGAVIRDICFREPFRILKGGRGGWGNRHFATPTRQAPRFSRPGALGKELSVSLELKLLADVGLVGLPNVGKSTLISVISSAKPKIGNYYFTTLVPCLGVVETKNENSFVVADIPGLIEGASEGKGLGHKFLRHIQRCRLLLHVVDVSCENGDDVVKNINIINEELKCFDDGLAKKKQVIVASKVDVADSEKLESVIKFAKEKELSFFKVSAITKKGIEVLIEKIYQILSELPKCCASYDEEFLYDDLNGHGKYFFEVSKKDDVFFC